MSSTTKFSEVNSEIVIKTREMHSGGEPLRVIESGWPAPPKSARTLLDKRRHMKEHMDHLRKLVMFEPRGHKDMYGALLVEPDHPDADLAVLFMHNEGYSTMCGHAIIALGRYVVDNKLIPAGRIEEPETKVNIQCPCGLVSVWVQVKNGKTGSVRFHSVPAFLHTSDLTLEIPGTQYKPSVDIGYGGAFYAVVKDRDIGIDLSTSTTDQIVERATAVSNAVRSKVKLWHPDSPDLAYLYGTIVTDGNDDFETNDTTTNLTIFADREVDRAPTGSGVTARTAIQYAKGHIKTGQVKKFKSSANGSLYTGSVVREVVEYFKRCSNSSSNSIVEVSGCGYYTGSSVFTVEDDDDLKDGFLLK
ncbi:hypothetical protein HELRODRAFT_110204 [Helobdella robusta]|uniref:trans-L-3-hydroxyproline dehydratase n=1 Tax=Helobdella robusta TaxID=6412 RepID=T1EF04_HELRO|nr:hypothetical protein HELRODRAFT_110204 [Helobdella robusta]ESO07908.1 hypothetical protein HELRODRAFT_110204 [Helobdella robusta]